jgi:hypothetical protein
MKKLGIGITRGCLGEVADKLGLRIINNDHVIEALKNALFIMIAKHLDSDIINYVIEIFVKEYLQNKTYYFYNKISNMMSSDEEIRIFKNYLNNLIESKINEKK